ncbi:MAG: PhzF family phenazine biosynthesis protein [Devosia sp.]
MRQWTIDAFTNRAFGGNPACVLEPLSEWPSDVWMQRLATENHAGATAFIVRGDTDFRFSLRWFTASVEVPLCGHATLAAAHALFNEIRLSTDLLEFDTASGRIGVTKTADRLELDMPAQHAQKIAPPPALTTALGAEPVEVWAGPYLIAILDSPSAVRAVRPDLDALRTVSLAYGGQGNVGVAAATDGAEPYDVIDRFFAPGYGIPEDAATGSFHCILAPIMADRLGKDMIRFHQASPERGADFICRVANPRVLLSGEAVTILESTLRISVDAKSHAE